MELYRISKREFSAIDGIGGLFYSGRWHRAGNRVVYTAQHRSLAALEYLVHLNNASLLQHDYVIATIYVPNDCGVEVINANDLVSDWVDFKQFALTQEKGTAFLQKSVSPLLRVPSAIIPQEYNFIINPTHPLMIKECKIIDINDFTFDGRLLKG